MRTVHGPRWFRVLDSLGRSITAETLERAKDLVRARPHVFPPGRRVSISGPSLGDPDQDDVFFFDPGKAPRRARVHARR